MNIYSYIAGETHIDYYSLQNSSRVAAGFLGYPQPGGGTHPTIPREGVLGDELGDCADLALGQAHKNSQFRVVQAAGA